jgi:hypothetical protein
MNDKFKKHYLQVVKAVTDQGEQIKKLNGIVMALQVDISKLKNDMITHGMTSEDKEQFQRVFQSDEETNKINPDPAQPENKESLPKGNQETLGC